MAARPPLPAPADTRALYVGVLFVSMAVLVLQIAMTRIFSFTIWYHFAYVTISLALLGYGASGTFVAIFPQLAGTSPGRRLAAYALGCGLAIVVALLAFAWLPFHPFALLKDPARQVPYALAYYVAATAPFFLAGLCISIALKTASHLVSRLYFFDLVGAGLGCFLAVFFISWLTTPGAIVAAAVLVSVAAVFFVRVDGDRRIAPTILAIVAIAAAGTGAVAIAEFKPSPDKFLAPFITAPGIRTYSHEWSPIFRTDVLGMEDEELSRRGSYASWGVSPHWRDEAVVRGPKIRHITHDGDAGAVIYNFDGDLSKLELFEHVILKVPYLVLDRPDVLVIGVGGGTDIVNAIKNRASHVTGVELDPVTVRQVKVDHADFAGHIYDRPDVTMIVGEGRSTVRHSGHRYDLIQMTGVDTLAALSTGAYVLSESYLYTTDAIGEFLDHLTPDGVLSVVLADFGGGTRGYSRHTMRQLALFVEGLHQRGIDDAENRIAIIASDEGVPQVALMLKNSPLTGEETERIRSFTDRMGFHVWALPSSRSDTRHSEYLHTPPQARAAFLDRQPLIMRPTTDDNPFFFNFYRWRNLGRMVGEIDVGHTLATGQLILGLILFLSIAFSTLLILLPLFAFHRQGLHVPGRWGLIAFFLAIGLGFIFIEISFVQKFVLFLGYPTYSLTVVLFSLLTYSGIGSFLSGRLRSAPKARVLPLFAALAAISLLSVALLPSLFDAFLGSPFPLRVAIASAALLPLGLVMGMFFPSGIEVVRRANVDFVPWAWGVNGCASVIGTVLAVILAMSLGFRVVTYLALATYLIGVLGLRASARAIERGSGRLGG